MPAMTSLGYLASAETPPPACPGGFLEVKPAVAIQDRVIHWWHSWWHSSVTVGPTQSPSVTGRV
jgi:hypothetical protein